MLMVLHPTYTLRVRVQDRMQQPTSFTSGQEWNPHRYFDSRSGKTGCDEVLAAVKDALSKAGIEADVSLDEFKHTG